MINRFQKSRLGNSVTRETITPGVVITSNSNKNARLSSQSNSQGYNVEVFDKGWGTNGNAVEIFWGDDDKLYAKNRDNGYYYFDQGKWIEISPAAYLSRKPTIKNNLIPIALGAVALILGYKFVVKPMLSKNKK
ncbi:MAG: hypothetical protein NW207_04770 [Cytophagales bacterium]|nr:hypothetical protein [Cytophagales bacterium]